MPELPEGVEPTQGGIYGFFAGLIDEGHSQNSAIGAFREAGGRGSNNFLRNTFNFVRDDMADRPIGWGLGGDQVLRPEHFTQWSTAGPTRYAYPVDVHVTFPSGEQGWMSTMVMADDMIDVDEAAGLAMDQLLFGQDPYGADYAVEVHGAMMRGSPYVMGGAG